MFNWLRRRRLSAAARKRLLVAVARAEEAIVETHVANVVDLLDALGDELDLDRTIELYAEMMALDETVAATVTNRVLTRLDEEGEAPAAPFRDVFRPRDR